MNPENPSVPYIDRVMEYPAHWTIEEAKDYIEANIQDACVKLEARVNGRAGAGEGAAEGEVIMPQGVKPVLGPNVSPYTRADAISEAIRDADGHGGAEVYHRGPDVVSCGSIPVAGEGNIVPQAQGLTVTAGLQHPDSGSISSATASVAEADSYRWMRGLLQLLTCTDDVRSLRSLAAGHGRASSHFGR